MKCPDIGILRAYLDLELTSGGSREVSLHLAACHQCAATLRELEESASMVQASLALLGHRMDQPSAPRLALARLRERSDEQGTLSAVQLIWQRRGGQIMTSLTTGWKIATGSILALCLVALVVMTPVGSAAEDLLGHFRVQRIAVVTVDPGDVPKAPNPKSIGSLEMVGSPEVRRDISLAQAQAMVSFPLKTPEYLPPSVPANVVLMASEEASFTYTFDREGLASYLRQMGAEDLGLADDLHGRVVRGRVPAVVAALYVGEGADPEAKPTGPMLAIVQAESPSYEAPAEFALLRDELLSLPNAPAGLASQMANIEDWQTTAVLPVPTDATTREVIVQGQPGQLISHGGQIAVLWQQNGIVYGVIGNVGETELLKVAESLR